MGVSQLYKVQLGMIFMAGLILGSLIVLQYTPVSLKTTSSMDILRCVTDILLLRVCVSF